MEEIFKAEKVVKKFINTVALDQVSVSIPRGSIYGLLGPNGAGKTTLIRIINQITAPDEGNLNFNGEKLRPEHVSRIGYLPEERGLYKKMKVGEQALYLARLKGLSKKEAMSRVKKWFGKFEILDWWNKKVEELSRGMGQLIQFLATIIHDPELIILDEPFAGLDPVNTELLKEIIHELKEQGRAIILSTHQMSQVEELCDRIMMINKGKNVLYGSLTDIKKKFSSNSIFVECQGEPGELEGVTGRRQHAKYLELFLGDGTSPDNVLKQLVSQGIRINRFEVDTPALHEIFIQVAGDKVE